MKPLVLLFLSSTLFLNAFASNRVVTNINELELANQNAKPGDTIVLKNGEWNNVTFKLDAMGLNEKPIVFKAESKGKVMITGNSKLLIGGSYLIIDGLYFTNGYSGVDAVIKFSINQQKIANHCRVTNTVINDFNNPKRLNENYWVALYGKNNRLDHCSFINKKNIGVLVAVILEDDRSRANYHSIDHNYFGFRTPLASNGGEIIRVGVSEYCEFNSNTIIEANFFEKCDGETEIISIKSCQNIVRNNVFKECQGAVVLRHGNYNTIANNVFLGNDKQGTGGVRVINKGQVVVNNFFYKCKGVDFRSPLSIMNGVPNSPANRYVGVSDAVIANNSFYDCTAISFSEGRSEERSIQPKNVQFINNLFYTKSDTTIYHIYDDISGIQFSNNLVSADVNKQLISGFKKANLKMEQFGVVSIPKTIVNGSNLMSDSIRSMLLAATKNDFALSTGYVSKGNYLKVVENASTNCGASWYSNSHKKEITVSVNCNNTAEITNALEKYKNSKLTINLTNNNYSFVASIPLREDVTFKTSIKLPIQFINNNELDYLFEIKGNQSLHLKNLTLNLSSLKAKVFVTSDTSGTSNHSNFTMQNCTISNFNGTFLKASKSSLLDSVFISNCNWSNGKGILLNLYDEKDNKGYYNVEKMTISNNTISNHTGPLLAILRSGKDESTLGPLVQINNNTFNQIASDNAPFILLNGVQQSLIQNNRFNNCNPTNKLIEYLDEVRAAHTLSSNQFEQSGTIIKNNYVTQK
jgi:poly(beta-D-mannuronate) lyase